MSKLAYEKKIDKLIPQAVKIADSQVKRADYDENEHYAAAWNPVYHDAMDRLAAEAGIRYSSKYRKNVTH